MKKTKPAANPDAYGKALRGWRREIVELLRTNVRSAGGKKLEEVIKWGHIVYLYNGPVLLIRAEDKRVLFGFWRGKQLTDLEPRLKPGGKYELATMQFDEGTTINATTVKKLVKQAIALNDKQGNPQDAVKK